MWKSYFTIALRNLSYHRQHAVINILGLSIGLTCCVIASLLVSYERSYDRWIPDHDQIFQVNTRFFMPNKPVMYAGQGAPWAVKDAFEIELPGLEALTRLKRLKDCTLKIGDNRFYDRLTLADANFFEVFDLPFALGSKSTALANTTSIVLTESAALKYFGSTDVLGKTLTVSSQGVSTDHLVSAVLKDLPNNTHFTFESLIPVNVEGNRHHQIATHGNWWYAHAQVYLKMSPQLKEQYEEKFPGAD